jgi:hypothetical protein
LRFIADYLSICPETADMILDVEKLNVDKLDDIQARFINDNGALIGVETCFAL